MCGWCPRLPITFVLGEWDAVAAMGVSCSSEEGVTLASDEDILVSVDGYARLGEDGNGAVITCFADTHEGMWEVVEGVGMCGSG